MDTRQGLLANDLLDHGLMIDGRNDTVNELRFERPLWVHNHRLRYCSVGAFSFYNPAGLAAAYRCRIGRYAQLGEATIIGPPEHPMDMFSTHPFAFTRPSHMPNMYRFEDFARLAPGADAGPGWADSQPMETIVGHEAYVGAGSFVRRGVTIGDGAVVGAASTVTRDVPPFAIVAGTPARVLRMRFREALVERFQNLRWWRYDLSPYKHLVDYTRVEATLAFFEQKAADGELRLLQPESYSMRREGDRYTLEKLPAPLY